MSDTPNIILPYIEVGQSQKEVTHNQALNVLDSLVQPTIIARLSSPPGSPANGQAWIVAASPTDAWVGKEAQISAWFDGWVFLLPKEGWTVFDQAADQQLTFSGVAWVDSLARPSPTPQIPALGGTWAGFGGGYASPRYYRTPDGRVTIEGTMQSGLDGTIFTLLAGYRPAARLMFGCWSGGGAYRVDVLADGQVQVQASNTVFSSLAGISFFAA